jgi:hypothetical protein
LGGTGAICAARASRRRATQIAPVPAPPDPPPPEPAPGDEPPARRLGEGIDERPIPRGCNPLVFGVVMATIQFAATIYFMRTC